MPIKIIEKIKGGLDYIATVLFQKKSVITRAVFLASAASSIK